MNSPAVMLWHPTRRAYLAAMGDGFTRRVKRAAIMRAADAEELRRNYRFGPLVLEPTFQAPNVAPRMRANLAEANDTELLRRAVRSLCARDRTRAPYWGVVMDELGLTSAAAARLCRRLDIDPKERTTGL